MSIKKHNTTENRNTSLTDIVNKSFEVKRSLKEEPDWNSYTLKLPGIELEGTITVLEYALNVYISKAHSLREELEEFREAYPSFDFENADKKVEEYLSGLQKADDKTLEDVTATHLDELNGALEGFFSEVLSSKPNKSGEEKEAIKSTSRNPTLEIYKRLEVSYKVAVYQTAITQVLLNSMREYFERTRNNTEKKVPIVKLHFSYNNPEYEIALQTYMKDLNNIVQETYNLIQEKIVKLVSAEPESEEKKSHQQEVNKLERMSFSLLQVKRYFSKKTV